MVIAGRGRWRTAWVLSLGIVVAPAVAGAQTRLPFPLRTPMSRTLEQLERSTMRPVPTVRPSPAPRPDMVWVPDRHVRIPGVLGDVHVPAHWERRLPDGEAYVPPLTGATPKGQVVGIPAGRYPPVEQRLAP